MPHTTLMASYRGGSLTEDSGFGKRCLTQHSQVREPHTRFRVSYGGKMCLTQHTRLHSGEEASHNTHGFVQGREPHTRLRVWYDMPHTTLTALYRGGSLTKDSGFGKICLTQHSRLCTGEGASQKTHGFVQVRMPHRRLRVWYDMPHTTHTASFRGGSLTKDSGFGTICLTQHTRLHSGEGASQKTQGLVRYASHNTHGFVQGREPHRRLRVW